MKKNILFIAITICTITYAYTQQLNAAVKNYQEELTIDTTKSELKWSCDYSFYFGGHYGFVSFKEGYFIKTEGSITGGVFTIDLHTITCTDIENSEANTGLVDHIKNEDFFDVNKYPEATLEITKTEYHDPTHLKIWANLTIKGITKSINFQAEVDYEKQHLITRFKIDRTLWGIDYKSKSMMSGVKDSAISDAIGFEVRINL